MSLRAISATLLVCLASTTAQAAPLTAYEMFPLTEGNVWVYATDTDGYLAGETGIEIIRADDEAYLGSNWFANHVDGLLGHGDWIYDHTHRAEMWVYSEGWSMLFDFGAPTGGSWSIDAGACDSYTATLASRNTTAVTPAGPYVGVTDVHLDRQVPANVRCGNPGLRNVRFSYGVGPVDWASDVQKGHLLYARLSDVVVAAGPHQTREIDGIETTFVVTKDVIEANPPIQCITWPCTTPPAKLGFALKVTNTTDEPQVISFSSGQRFEVDLFDAEGAYLSSWSDGRFFTQALGHLQLAPGQTEVFHGAMPLGTEGGQVTGELQLVGYLEGSLGNGKHDVWVEVVPAQ